MLRRRSELGEGKGGCIFGLICFVVSVFIAWKMIPVKVKAAELRQEVVDQAKSAGNRGPDKIKLAIMTKAKELQLPLQEKDLKIDRGNDRIIIKATYYVPIEFPGFTYNWKFEHNADNPIF